MTRSAALLLSLCLSWLLLTACTGKDVKFSAESYPAALPETTDGIPAAADSGDLRLAAGDSLSIDVWGQEEMSRQTTLDASGAIYFPFVGKIDAQGMTVAELRAVLSEKLSFYYVNPQVTVMPVDLAGQCYYVLGEVSIPGKITMKAKTSVLEAAAAAGGPTKTAGNFIVLLRKQKDQLHLISIPLRFQNLTAENGASVAMQVQANDILFLPPSEISDVETFMKSVDGIIAPLLSIQRGVLYWPAFKNAIQGSSERILVQ